MVEVGDEQYAIQGEYFETVRIIVCVDPVTALCPVPIEVEGELRVLIEIVRRPIGRVYDIVIAIQLASASDDCGSHVATVVIVERFGVAADGAIQGVVGVC